MNPTQVLIFGAGVAGQNAFQQLKSTRQVVAFVDNDEQKQGSQVLGLSVIAPEQIGRFSPQQVLIASEFFEKIQAQLMVLGLSAEQIQVLPSHMLSPLQFDSEQTRDSAVQLLHCLASVLDDAKVPYFIDAGTLLGVVRDNALIPWDDDLDFAVEVSHADALEHALQGALTQLNQQLGGQWQLSAHHSQFAFGAIQPGDLRCYKLHNQQPELALPMVDFFIKYPRGEQMDYALASRGITMPLYHMQSLTRRVFAGCQLSLPEDPEGYLQAYYGDWRTPKKHWTLADIQPAKVF